MKTVLLTGAAGFIGSKTSEMLLDENIRVVGIDNLNDYYDIRLKRYRLSALRARRGFEFCRGDIEDGKTLDALFKKYKFDAVVNLAARAGVRYSLTDPLVYYTTNTIGTLNLLERCKSRKVGKFVLASTSSLYAGQKMPFKEDLPVNTPISPYAASKKAAELTAYTYHFHYGIDVTVVRYFTVYGPAGRPDMSVFRFIKWVDEGRPIDLYGDGRQSRDFTYIDDIAAGTVKALRKVGFEIVNLGGGKRPYTLNHVIGLIEKNLGKKAKIKPFDFPKADIQSTWADISKAGRILRWKPSVGLNEGIERSVAWYRENKRWLNTINLER